MWFLASLFTTFGAAYAYRKVERFSAEIAIGCVAIGLIGVVSALIIAPWQIQLALLMGVVLSSRLLDTPS